VFPQEFAHHYRKPSPELPLLGRQRNTDAAINRSESGGRAPGEGGDQMDFVAVRQDLSLDGLAAVYHQQDGLVIAGNRHVVQ
jgi:hypothetical protein